MARLNSFRVVLFDFIGTTVLEAKPDVIEHCFSYAFAKSGIAVTPDFIRANRGRNKRDVIHEALNNNSTIEVDKVLFDFEEAVNNQIKSFQAAPDVALVFNTLQRKNIQLAIATGLSRDLFDKIMKHLNWSQDWFAYQSTYEEVGKGRPHPDLILDLMHKLNLTDPQEILKVGDTVADILEGKNGGTQTAALLAGTQPVATLQQNNPDYLFRSLRDILMLVQ